MWALWAWQQCTLALYSTKKRRLQSRPLDGNLSLLMVYIIVLSCDDEVTQCMGEVWRRPEGWWNVPSVFSGKYKSCDRLAWLPASAIPVWIPPPGHERTSTWSPTLLQSLVSSPISLLMLLGEDPILQSSTPAMALSVICIGELSTGRSPG